MNKNFLEICASWIGKSVCDMKKAADDLHCGEFTVYTDSIHMVENAFIFLARNDRKRFLVAVGKTIPAGFEGETFDFSGCKVICGDLSEKNAAALRKYFSWCAPVSLRRIRTTVGCGDRLGLATRGHLLATKQYQVSPVLAQQSMRELSMTKRTFRKVVDDATFMVYECDYQDGYGADGDHLKTIRDIDVALEAGMPMITLDLSDIMNAAAGDWTTDAVEQAFAALPEPERTHVMANYAGKTFRLEGLDIAFDELTARRCAVMYNKALDFAVEVYHHLEEKRGDQFDLEISIDETTTPTVPSHHLYIAAELNRRGVIVSSLAPRFVGEFQKAVDYIGDLAEFDRQFKYHTAIARQYGNYKISVHSGSDKFSVYPAVGRETKGYLHLKTAGTSWLVAVEVIAKCDPELYRAMHRCAEKNFNDMLKLYHITADLSRISALDSLSDAQLPDLMRHADARQLLHITYGPILTGDLRERFFAAMHKYEKEYTNAVKAHFEKHLSLLGCAKKGK